MISDQNIEAIKKLCAKHKVDSLYAFGSVLTKDFNENSDIDFLINFSPNLSIEDYTENYFLLHKELEALFGKNIDLVTERSLSNPYLIESINSSKELIYNAA